MNFSERLMFIPRPSYRVGEVKRIVEEALITEFGADSVDEVIVEKYPGNYEVIVLVHRPDLKAMYRLADWLQGEFARQGYSVGFWIGERKDWWGSKDRS